MKRLERRPNEERRYQSRKDEGKQNQRDGKEKRHLGDISENDDVGLVQLELEVNDTRVSLFGKTWRQLRLPDLGSRDAITLSAVETRRESELRKNAVWTSPMFSLYLF